ncbi:hypothetical protein ACS0TY_006058 [Phlomoides rotata]
MTANTSLEWIGLLFTNYVTCFSLLGGLSSSRNVIVSEKVAMFFSVLAHHTKNRCVKFQFRRSGQTVSKHFHAVLNCVLRLHNLFLVTPQPIPDDSTYQRWGKFKVVWVHWMIHM